MLAYAAPRPSRQTPHPKTLSLIVAGHVIALGAVMFAKGDVVPKFTQPPLVMQTYREPNDPPPQRRNLVKPCPAPRHIPVSKPVIDTPMLPKGPVLSASTTPSGPADGTGTAITQQPDDPPLPPPHDVIRTGPRIATSEAMLRPPYPVSKRMIGEEATLTLRLSIDERGRVSAVEPVGSADRTFLDAARKHLLRAWRFTPATQDGIPVPSTKVITLHFQLGDA